MNVLLLFLKTSILECQIGDLSMGALGYGDDDVIVAI